jgi:hypothetical protein
MLETGDKITRTILEVIIPWQPNIPGLYSFLGVSGAFCPGLPRISPVRGLTGKTVPRGTFVLVESVGYDFAYFVFLEVREI